MAKRRYSRSSPAPLILIGVTALGLLGMVGVCLAWLAGAFEPDKKRTEKPVDRTGQLAFPALARDVPAFEKLSRDDFVNPATGQLNVAWLPEAMQSSVSRSMGDLIGRVTSRDKGKGMVLTEADFLEKGTRPGLAAGIPVGKFALSVPASGIAGLEQLRHGDRFDLLIALPKREGQDQVSNSEPAALFGGIKPPSLRVGQLSQQHGVKHLVTSGMLVQLYKGPTRSTTGPVGLTVQPNAKSKTTTSSTLFAEIAVDGEEIGPLTEAISLGTKLTCILRSGKPDDETEDTFSTEGLVPVITTAVAVSAFSALTDENLIDDSTGQLHFYYFPPEKVAESWITDPTELYGRVISRDLRRGSFITRDDLLPSGTRPGISAGLKPGMSAISFAKMKIQGFEKLTVGETFSILTRVPGDVAPAAPSTTWATIQGGKLSAEDERLANMVRTGIREVVRDAIYLSETDEDNVVVGVPESDISKLAQLLRDQADVFAVAHSSQDKSTSIDRSETSTITRTEKHSPFQPQQRFIHTIALQDALLPGGADEVAVPILAREVPEFSELSIEDFIDPATGRVQTLLFDANAVGEDWELDIRELIDRVAQTRLRAGRPVTSDDLAPEGSLAGPSLGLSEGMRGVTVNAAELLGLSTVPIGTKFDIVSAAGVDVNSLADTVRQSLSSADAVREASKFSGGRISASRTVASQVKLLSNLGEAQVLIAQPGSVTETQSQTQLTPDGSTITETTKSAPVTYETRTVQQYVLAVPEGSVSSLLGLLDPQRPLRVSLRPEVEKTTETLNPTPEPPVRPVIQEHIRGTDRQREIFLTDRPDFFDTSSAIGFPAGSNSSGSP